MKDELAAEILYITYTYTYLSQVALRLKKLKIFIFKNILWISFFCCLVLNNIRQRQ